MKPLVGVIAPGNMGAAVARRLGENGIEVWTSLAGRSDASVSRAAAAGMRPVADERLAEVDMILAILPPSEAHGLALRLSGILSRSARKPAYVDCNAVSPATTSRIAQTIADTGCAFVDAGIIGGPPKPGESGPRIYVSGRDAAAVGVLARFGLDIHVLDAPIGAASALKMSYAGITKGLVALGSVMALAATRANAQRALYAELARSQPALLSWLGRYTPGMYGKAYRWVGEMREISDFVGEDAAGRAMFAAMADLYARLARDAATSQGEIERLAAFVGAFARAQ